MRLPRPRFTVRRLMVLVVIGAALLALGGAIRSRIELSRRREALLQVAAHHAFDEDYAQHYLETFPDRIAGARRLVAEAEARRSDREEMSEGAGPKVVLAPGQDDPEHLLRRLESQQEGARRRLVYYDTMRRKYEEAAAHPLLPVPPDPPVPDW